MGDKEDESTNEPKERDRLKILPHILKGEMTVVYAAEMLSLSERRLRRVVKRYALEGDRGLIHRGRGRDRVSNHKYNKSMEEECLRPIRAKYIDFGLTLASEYLFREHGLKVSRETVRRWMKSEGIWHFEKEPCSAQEMACQACLLW